MREPGHQAPPGGTSTARFCQAVAWTPHPHRGKRLGEATHPGPPDIGEAVRRRERALHALAQMQLLPPHTSPLQREDNGAGSETDAAGTLSDTLSAATPFASPRGAELSGAMAPMAPGEATPGFSPPRSQDTPPQQETNAEPLPWQDARPPSSVPGERNSWLFVPLLHAAAGNLTERANQAWRDCPAIGPRFGELVALLRDSPPVMPTTLARTLLAVAECDAHDGARHVMQEDVETATALTGMPDAPVPLAAAILLCMAPDGYLTAATQSALLESYAGAMAAAAASSLADDARRTPDANEPVATTRRRRRRARRHSAPREDPHPPPSTRDEHSGVPTCPAAADELGAVPTAQPAGIPATAWAALDAVDPVAELQNPVPTLQDIPPFMRAAVRGALVTALSRLRNDYATATAGDYAATSRA